MPPTGEPPQRVDNPLMPPVGQAINGRYQLTKVLGQGGFATVYLAEDLLAGGRLAVKVLDPNRSGEPDFAARFRQEVALVRQLQHHNTIKIFDMGTTEQGCLFMVQEFVEGQELTDLIEESGGLSPERVVHITAQILRSLSEAHECGVVHRDLKPENVMIRQLRGEPDYVKVVDFGIAKGMSPEMSMVKTMTGAVLCTPSYAAPELLRGRDVGPQVDIYSLGLMMMEMLTGKQVVTGESLADLIVVQLSDDPIPIPRQLRTSPLTPIIERAVAKDIRDRYITADSMLYDLQRSGFASTTGTSPVYSAKAQSASSRALAPTTDAIPSAVARSKAAVAKSSRSTPRGGYLLILGLALIGLAVAYWVMTRESGEADRTRAVGTGDGTGTAIGPTTDDGDHGATVGPREHFSEAEWAGLLAPGNLLEPPQASSLDPNVPRGGILRRPIHIVPLLNPMQLFSPESIELYRYIHRSIAYHDRAQPERIVPDLAYRVEVGQNYQQFRVFLRHGIRWQQPTLVTAGNPRHAWMGAEHFVTADDFAFAIELIQNPALSAPVLVSLFDGLERIEIVHDYELVLHWKSPIFSVQELIVGLIPLPRWLYGVDDDGQPLDAAGIAARFGQYWMESSRVAGTGPYQIARYDPLGTVELVRWDGYVGDAPLIERIVYQVMTDSDERWRALVADRLDIVDVRPERYASAIRGGAEPGFADGTLESGSFQTPFYVYLGWNGARPPFDDARVRRAMTHALDRERIVEEVYFGMGRVVSGPFQLDGPNYDTSIEPWPFDLDRAGHLLAEAGWIDTDGDGIRDRVFPDGRRPLSFSVLVPDYRDELRRILEIFRDDLARVGVRLWIESIAVQGLIERVVADNFDGYVSGWATAFDPDPYPIWHSSQVVSPGANMVDFRNGEADSILDSLRRTFDEGERAELFHRLHAILHREQPYTFMFAPVEFLAWQSRLRNVSFSIVGPYDYSTSWYMLPE